MSHRVSKTLWIDGMSCSHCEHTIESQLQGMKGIQGVNASYRKGTTVVSYNPDIISLDKIRKTIEKTGYRIRSDQPQTTRFPIKQTIGIAILFLGIYSLLNHLNLLTVFSIFPQADSSMGYGMLLAVGFLTSFHCLAMCGGIHLTQCLPTTNDPQPDRRRLKASLYYNLGRVLSYTLIGGIIGALGAVFSISSSAKGLIQLVAGLFMILMGVNMLGLFPVLRRFNPQMPRFIAKRVHKKRQGVNSPLIIGLLNGFMPCGPLQAMQLYALSTGSPIKGAFSMFLFSMGTVPLLFGLGALSTLLSKRYQDKIMHAGAVLVVLLGIGMLNNGLGLRGVALYGGNGAQQTGSVVDQIQVVQTDLSPRYYEPIAVYSGIPVQWTITAEEGALNGCNYRIIIPQYGIDQALDVGDNLITFTPEEPGTVAYSCWMGMIRSTITVVES